MDAKTFIVHAAVLTSVLLGVAIAYPTGAPPFACDAMIPSGHGATNTSGPSPFKVNISIAVYKPGSIVEGYIYSDSNVIFRGFLIQARSATTNSSTPIGRFIDPVNLTHTQCGNDQDQGLTHSNSTDRTQVGFSWKAPYQYSGDVQFKLTVVETFEISRYWLDIHSDVIMDCSRHNNIAACSEITTEAPDTSPPGTEHTSTATSITATTQNTATSITATTQNTATSITATTQNTATSITATTQNTPTTAPPGKIVNDKNCGVTKGCFFDCTDTSCTYLVTWQAAADKMTVDFDMKIDMDSMDDVWIAAGLSSTGFMDGTEVIACLSMSQGIVIQSSINRGYSNKVFKDSELGLSNGRGVTTDGIFQCRVTRRTNMSDPDFLSLTTEYYLLVGHGPVKGGFMTKHSSMPLKTKNKVDFLAFTVAKADNSVSILIKVHASLMIVAWVFLSSVGIVAARQCKNMLAHKLYMGVKAWFLVHRPAMVIATLCVIAAIVAIFVEVGRFENRPAGPKYTEAHPFLGLVVTGLTVLNPLMAMFRPAPDAKNRYIFNWAHFVVGTSAHISAIITICFALKLEKARVNVAAFYIMVAYALIFMLVQVVLELHNTIKKHPKKQAKYVTYGSVHDEDSVSHPDPKESGPLSATDATMSSSSKLVDVPVKSKETSTFAAYVLVFHGLAMLVIAGLLIAIICIPLDLM